MRQNLISLIWPCPSFLRIFFCATRLSLVSCCANHHLRKNPTRKTYARNLAPSPSHAAMTRGLKSRDFLFWVTWVVFSSIITIRKWILFLKPNTFTLMNCYLLMCTLLITRKTLFVFNLKENCITLLTTLLITLTKGL